MIDTLGQMLLGIFLYVGYKTLRSLRSAGWDTSNALNVLRMESYSAIHPENYPKMYVLTDEQVNKLIDFGWENIDDQRPFKFLGGDEFKDHFPESLQ